MDVSELGNSLRSPDQVGSVLIPVQDNDYTLYSNLFKNINGFTPPNQLSFVFGESDNEYEVIVDSFTKDRVKYNILKVIYNGIKYKINVQGNEEYPSFFIREFISPENYKTWYGSFIISNQIPFRPPFILQPAGQANVVVNQGQRAIAKAVQPRRAVAPVNRSAAAQRGVETRRRNLASAAASREAAVNVMTEASGPSRRELRAIARSDGDINMLFGKGVKKVSIKQVLRDIKYLKQLKG